MKAMQISIASSTHNSRTFLQQQESNSPLADAKEHLRAASAALAEAFRKFSIRTDPVYSVSTVTTEARAAMLTGRTARTVT